jgi:mRNA-degrading endonuclease RelE of RelBE toxin-antitoxin system
MKYDVFLSSQAKKQFKRFDAHIRHKIKTELLELEEDPSEKGSLLQGFSHGTQEIHLLRNFQNYQKESKADLIPFFLISSYVFEERKSIV